MFPRAGYGSEAPFFIYAVRLYRDNSFISNYFKVGISSQPQRRVSMLNNGTPDGVRLIFLSSGMRKQHAVEQESAIHRALRENRCKGEWFHITIQSLLKILAGIVEDGYEDEISVRSHTKLRQIFDRL